METIKITEFKDIISGKYKGYPLIFGIREDYRSNRYITAVYIDNESNQIKPLYNREIDELKESILLRICEKKKIYKKIKELKAKIQNFKEFFKIIKSLKMFYLLEIFLAGDTKLNISEKDFAYWIYNKIYYGTLDKETYLELITLGGNSILDIKKEDTIEMVAKRFIEKGLNNGQQNDLTIEI